MADSGVETGFSPSSPSSRKRRRTDAPAVGSCGSAELLDVAVIDGAGRVGLPLGLVLAELGHRVRLLDRDSAALETIRKGSLPFLEEKGLDLLTRCLAEFPDRLQISSDYSLVRECTVIIVTVGTPVDEHLNPDFTVGEAGVRALRPFLRDGQTLMLRSPVFPGTAERLAAKLKEEGLDVGVAFCPERLAEGRRVTELREVPQLLAGSSASALAHSRLLFGPLAVDLVELGLLEAEVAVLFLNAWRYVVLGTANQFYHIATSKGLDFGRVRKAIMHRYRRALGFPGAGLTAGPRLFKDTMQLAAYCRHTFSLGHAAMLVNETMPDCLLDQAKRELALSGRTLAGAKCGILGMAFKPDSDDGCESLAFKLRRLLSWEGAEVRCTDAHLHREDFVDAGSLIEWSDVVFVGCPHEGYKDLAFRDTQLVFDCWGALDHTQPTVNIEPGQPLRGEEAPLKVAIIGGAGHVGLPLSLVLADCGHHVFSVDVDHAKLDSIRAGKFPFLEAGGPELLTRCLKEFPERLTLTDQYSSVRECDIIIVTIGTPVDEHLNPCFSVIEVCVKSLRPHLRNDGQTLVLRSTLFPGTSARVRAALEKGGLGGVGLSFCPERIAQGEALRELRELPQIVSGSSAAALAHAKALFGPLGVDLIELELQEAEAAKLFLNAWRYVVFGTANQFYHIATSKGLDFERIRSAIVDNYPRAAGFPRSGFTAGPCLFKDTMQLAAYCRHTFSLGHAAMLVNETMPDSVLELARRHLAQERRQLAGSRCGILGMAFKPDNDDLRESLAFKLRRLLLWEGAEVLCTDVYMRRDDFVDAARLLERCDLIFVGCPHREYRQLTFDGRHQVFDCWGALGHHSLPIAAPAPLMAAAATTATTTTTAAVEVPAAAAPVAKRVAVA